MGRGRCQVQVERGGARDSRSSEVGQPKGVRWPRAACLLVRRGSEMGMGYCVVLVVVVVVVVILCWLESASNAVRVTSTFPY